MQVIDLETKEVLDIQDLVNKLVNQDNADGQKQSRFSMETKLDSYYRTALKMYSYNQSFNIAQVILMPGLGKRLLQELEDMTFPYMHEKSTDGDFLKEVIMALINIIPGGYISKQFVRDFMEFVVLNGRGRNKVQKRDIDN